MCFKTKCDEPVNVPMTQCPFDKSHLVSHDDYFEHIEKCERQIRRRRELKEAFDQLIMSGRYWMRYIGGYPTCELGRGNSETELLACGSSRSLNILPKGESIESGLPEFIPKQAFPQRRRSIVTIHTERETSIDNGLKVRFDKTPSVVTLPINELQNKNVVTIENDKIPSYGSIASNPSLVAKPAREKFTSGQWELISLPSLISITPSSSDTESSSSTQENKNVSDNKPQQESSK